MLVARDEQRCWLTVPAAIAESVVARLRMFSIGREVELDADHAALVDDAGDGLPLEYDRDRRLGIEAGARPVALPAQWLRRDIACGMPWLVEATQGRFLPQMLGLEALGGLSYAKGCYPGQEVIARVHYRGRVTRRPARFVLDRADPPEPGAEGEVEGEPAAVLYAVDRAGDGGVEGLAVVPADTPATASLRVGRGVGELVSA
jgi:folate-binding protein YgfZ